MASIGGDISAKMAEKFFASRGHGVLSLADENSGYGTPISYGYDQKTNHCIIQFVIDSSSQKQRFLEASDSVTLTTYEHNADGAWQSAVATGSLVSLSNEDVANWAAALFFKNAANTETPARREASDTDIKWYKLEIESLTGRENIGNKNYKKLGQ